jgi:uncharacterized damage-inducible protein DinB
MRAEHPVRHLLARVYSADPMSRIVDPTLADLPVERGHAAWLGDVGLMHALMWFTSVRHYRRASRVCGATMGMPPRWYSPLSVRLLPMSLILLLLPACICAVAPFCSAQTTGAGYADALSPSLASVAQRMHATIRRDLEEAAAAMPAEEYSFRPTADVRTFAQVVGHVIDAESFFCSQARQQRPPTTRSHEQISDKRTLVKALSDVLTYCDRAYDETTDANFNQPVQMAPGVGMGPAKTVRGAILMFNTTHDNEHYGNIVVYMRLKGHVPPSTARALR